MLNGEFDPDKFREALLSGNIRKDLKLRLKDDRSQRKWAEQERESKDDKKGSRPMFLRPQDISGDYDFKRALRTTLGMPEGQTRIMTQEDLRAFAANIEQMQQAYKGGITVEQVISLSTQDDIDRANKQIHVALPQGQKDGVVHFITNASRQTTEKDPRAPRFHHVNVEFLAFNELVFNPDKIKTTTVQNRLAKGKVKIECDCGRFKYWLRYLNTVAGTVVGRKEGGFPKEKNPGLTGIACKHILRVMHFVKSQPGQHYLAQALAKERTKQVGQRHRVGKNENIRQLSEQIVRANTKRNEIKPNLMREVAKIERKAQAAANALLKKQKATQTKAQAIQKLKSLHSMGLLTDSEFAILSKK